MDLQKHYQVDLILRLVLEACHYILIGRTLTSTINNVLTLKISLTITIGRTEV